MSAFYCKKKHCRKTAWGTPEYLSEEDWRSLALIVAIIESGDVAMLSQFLTDDFFNKMIGWPEGIVYCADYKYLRMTGMMCLTRNLSQLKEALSKHESKSIKSNHKR